AGDAGMRRRWWLVSLTALITALTVAVWTAWRLLPGEELRWLDALPEVARVERPVSPFRPAGALVHLCDWHLGDERQRQDERHLAEVEQVQAEHVAVLQALLAKGHWCDLGLILLLRLGTVAAGCRSLG